MNAGMYHSTGAPVGLYIENQATLAPLDTNSGSGNFYLKPNGVFYITVGKIPVVCSTAEFKPTEPVQFATQSGPMLLIHGQIHPAPYVLTTTQSHCDPHINNLTSVRQRFMK
jgi:uncharacterized protein YigE (DUF2233 family)